MQKLEVITFMKKIKAYYQTFSMEDYVVKEWQDRLKPFDIEDVYAKLDQHLRGEQKEQIPKLHYITRFLKTPEEKKKARCNDYLIRCNLCGQEMRLSEYDDKHLGKCSSINYLLRIMKDKGIKVEYEELETLDEIKFQKVYEKYKDY